MVSKTEVFRVRSKTNGLFSNGGSEPSFVKAGKIWRTKGNLSSHFTNLNATGRKTYKLHEAEVVRYVLIEEEAHVSPTSDWMNASAERIKIREDESKAVMERWQKERELRELNALLKKHPQAAKGLK